MGFASREPQAWRDHAGMKSGLGLTCPLVDGPGEGKQYLGGTATLAFITPTLGFIREYPNRVACDWPVSGFPLLEEFVTPFG